MGHLIFYILFFLIFAIGAQGSIVKQQKGLEARFKKSYNTRNKHDFFALKEDVLKASGKAVPLLISVMKNEDYPDSNRWLATFLLGRIMGKKASPFIANFLHHPNWVLRVAALKTLLILKEKRYSQKYAMALKDKSLLVRRQALDNIVGLQLKDKAPSVWALLYDERNYYDQEKKKGKTTLIKAAIKAVGELNYQKAQGALIAMNQKREYADVRHEIKYSLELLTK